MCAIFNEKTEAISHWHIASSPKIGNWELSLARGSAISVSIYIFSFRSDLTFLLQHAEWNSHNKQTDRKRLAAVNYSHFFSNPKTCFRTHVADIRMEARKKNYVEWEFVTCIHIWLQQQLRRDMIWSSFVCSIIYWFLLFNLPFYSEFQLPVPDPHRRRALRGAHQRNQSRFWHTRRSHHSADTDDICAATQAISRASTCLGRAKWHSQSAAIRVSWALNYLFCFILKYIQFWMIQLSFLFSHPRSYELPPPSRSRDNTLNIFDPNYNEVIDNPHITSHQPVTPSPVLVNFSNQFGYRLVPVYIPGEGYRYLIAVPSDKWNHLNTNHISDHQQQKYDKYEKYDKYNGRYNAKLKKYKAYEKFLKPQQQLKQQVMQARRV